MTTTTPHGFTATANAIRQNGKVIATIKGWWDSQMMAEDITFKSPEAKAKWEAFRDERRHTTPSWAPDTTLDIGEGGVLYNLIHKRY